MATQDPGTMERLAALVMQMIQQGQNPLGDAARAAPESAFNASQAGVPTAANPGVYSGPNPAGLPPAPLSERPRPPAMPPSWGQ